MKLTEYIIEKNFPNLKFVVSCTTGLDHINTDYCKQKGIEVISLRGETEFLQDVHATAEHTWALILALVRKLPFAHNDVCVDNWDRERWQGIELHGKKLGIIGYGRVGRQVAGYVEAFGMFPLVCDKEGHLEFVLRNADIVTIHVPLTDETRGMFSYDQFKLMKPTACFINTSRGQVVDEEALLWALEQEKIVGAALDVANGEPNNINPALLEYARTHSNLIVTPHTSGNTQESREKTQVFLATKIKDFITG
jgi:D-3-phosphoglycerate dehydrogenase